MHYLAAAHSKPAPAESAMPPGNISPQYLIQALAELEAASHFNPLVGVNSRHLPLQDKLGRDVAAQTAKLAESVGSSSQKVLDANTKYAADHLKGFEQEGKYAAATIQQARQQMQQVEAAVVAVR